VLGVALPWRKGCPPISCCNPRLLREVGRRKRNVLVESQSHDCSPAPFWDLVGPTPRADGRKSDAEVTRDLHHSAKPLNDV
jgi:hypothetical protein